MAEAATLRGRIRALIRTGKEKLCLKALNTPKVEHWLDYKWRYLKEGAEPGRPATATTGRPSTAAASRPASARP